MSLGRSKQNMALFAVRVAWIIHDQTQRITEYTGSFLKRYAMLGPVRRSLPRVPFES